MDSRSRADLNSSDRVDASLAENLGSRLRERRKVLHLTLAVVAAKADTSVSHLSSVEKGVSLPSLPFLARLAEALDLEIADVLRGNGNNQVLTSRVPTTTTTTQSIRASHPQLQLKVELLACAAGESGDCPLPLTTADLFVFVVRGALKVLVNGIEYALADGDALDARTPGLVTWRTEDIGASVVWSVCPSRAV